MDEALWSATRNVGVLFAETLDWSQSDLAALRRFDALLVGSTWCGAGLEAAAAALDGAPLPPVKAFMQGVDGSLFKPPTGVRRRPGARFRVFSGGKLEWRKGQDIVVAAFREFRRRHPDADAELVVAWANPWRTTVLTMANATHTAGVPAATRQQVLEANATAPLPRTDADYVDENAALLDWLEANGLDRRDVVPLIPVHHRYVPQILRAVDAALFPNRAEGGTNLVAMEAVAMGVPTALARNTGQADLVDFLGGDDGCWPLGNQVESPAARAAPDQFAGYETDPGDAAAALADIYRDRAAARRRALRGAKRMRAWSWESAVEVLTDAAFG
jgi:glycosyltransferase involved in cell wall biosynthesis